MPVLLPDDGARRWKVVCWNLNSKDLTSLFTVDSEEFDVLLIEYKLKKISDKKVRANNL